MKIPKRVIVFLLISIICGIILVIGPEDTPTGNYNLILRFENVKTNSWNNVTLNFTLSDQVSDPITTTLNSGNFDIIIRYFPSIKHSANSAIEYRVQILENRELVSLKFHQIEILLVSSESGQKILLKPIKIDNNNYIFKFQPLIKAKSSLIILSIVAIFWFSEIIPLAFSSFLIPLLTVLFLIMEPDVILSPFFSSIVTLFIGSFLLEKALRKHKLDELIANVVLTRSPNNTYILLLFMMGMAAFFSFWISNSASAAIMLVVTLAVLNEIKTIESPSYKPNDETPQAKSTRLDKVFILGIAYSASVGGIATIIGTSPNAIAVGLIDNFLGINISFLDWMLFGLPVTLLMVPTIFLILLLVFRPEKHLIKHIEYCLITVYEGKINIKLNKNQIALMSIFIITIFGWFTQKIPDFISDIIGWNGHGISAGIIALIPVILLPLVGLLDQDDVKDINWNAIIIIGGGLSLGTLIIGTGISDWVANSLSAIANLPNWLIIILIGGIALCLTMIASNTASAAILIPVVIPLGVFLNIDPVLLGVLTAIACSIDFALPMGTPPSTLAYSTGKVEFREMMKAGIILNIIGLFLLTTVVVFFWSILGLVSL
ncbi:MAG: SLC13 family permease [Candidatus Hodarchaeales archaeon]|jgi:sodium-dependent dicarboxylate transporter 2/3/5